MFRYVNLPCGVCDSDNYDFLGYRGGEAHRSGKGEKCRIVKCISCGHIYPKPFPLLKDTNEAYKDTSEYFASHDAKLKIEKYTRLLRKLETDLGYKGKLLDFGSGRGELLFAAQQLGWYVRGIETSKEFAEFARLTYGVKVENCSLARANYPDNHFDVVTLGAVLEHLYHPKQILLQINRIIKAKGILWIDAPNEGSLYNMIGNIYLKIQFKNWVTNLSPTFRPYHVQGFTKKSITKILLEAGFNAEMMNTFAGKALLQHKGFKQFAEFCGVLVFNKISNILNMGSFMEVVARKTRTISTPQKPTKH